jgi:hypothetical protein
MDDKGDRNRESLEAKIDRNRQELDSLRQEMHTNFRWIVGIQITTWITVLIAILFR